MRKQMLVDEEALNKAIADAALDAQTAVVFYDAIGYYLRSGQRKNVNKKARARLRAKVRPGLD